MKSFSLFTYGSWFRIIMVYVEGKDNERQKTGIQRSMSIEYVSERSLVSSWTCANPKKHPKVKDVFGRNQFLLYAIIVCHLIQRFLFVRVHYNYTIRINSVFCHRTIGFLINPYVHLCVVSDNSCGHTPHNARYIPTESGGFPSWTE